MWSTVIQRLRRTANTVTGMAVYFRPVQNINITGRITKSDYPYTMQSSDMETLYKAAPEMPAKIAEIDGLRDVTSDLYIKNPQMTIEIDREKAGGLWDHRRADPPGIVQRLRRAPGGDDLHAVQRLPGDPGSAARIPGRSVRPVEDLPQDQRQSTGGAGVPDQGAAGAAAGGGVGGVGASTGPVVPLSAVTRIVPTIGPLQVNHQGQQPAVTISFNLAPGFSLGQAVDAIKKIERESESAGHDRDQLPGRRAGVPGLAQGAGHPGAGGDLRRLCGARHPLRELHPPDHDHFRPAVGRRRRADHPDAVQHGPVGHRHDRHRHAGRHRQEERDHDDRLRARAPARGPVAPKPRSARPRCCASARS